MLHGTAFFPAKKPSTFILILQPNTKISETTMAVAVAEAEAEARNWADLPRDVLHLIYTKLPPDLHYYVIFRSVCKNWYDFDSLNEPPPKFPWILKCNRERYFGDGGDPLGQNLRYYSLTTGEIGTIRVPKPFQGKNFHGPGLGYLLVSSCQKLSLLNPLTGDVISLPRLTHGFKALYPVCDGLDPTHSWHIAYGFPSLLRIWDGRSVIYHHNEKNWTYVDNDKCATCFWNGRLYTTEERCCTKVFDAVSGEKLDVDDYIEPPEDEGFQVVGTYLVESCQEILRVSWFLDFAEKAEGAVFHIYKLLKSEEGERQHRRWVKASDIGDQILFLDVVNSFSVMAPSGFKGNCIYFLDIGDGSQPYRFDIGTSTVEKVPCPFDSCTWFVPSLG